MIIHLCVPCHFPALYRTVVYYVLLLFTVPIFALERFPFLSSPILDTCICSFNLHSAVASSSNPIGFDMLLSDFLPEPISSLYPSMPSFQSVGRPTVVNFWFLRPFFLHWFYTLCCSTSGLRLVNLRTIFLTSTELSLTFR